MHGKALRPCMEYHPTQRTNQTCKRMQQAVAEPHSLAYLLVKWQNWAQRKTTVMRIMKTSARMVTTEKPETSKSTQSTATVARKVADLFQSFHNSRSAAAARGHSDRRRDQKGAMRLHAKGGRTSLSQSSVQTGATPCHSCLTRHRIPDAPWRQGGRLQLFKALRLKTRPSYGKQPAKSGMKAPARRTELQR